MKKVFLSIFIMLISVTVFAQENLSFAKVIPVEGANKEEIYATIRAWVASSYKSANTVIQMDDKDAGLIVCNALFRYSYERPMYAAYEGTINYILKLQIKDGRFRAEMTNFYHKIGIDHATAFNQNCNLGLITTAENYTDKGAHKKFHNNVWNDIKTKAESYSNNIFEELAKSSKNIISVDETAEDW